MADAGSATAATLGFSITNLAPAGSLSLEPALLQPGTPDITDVFLTQSGGGGMEALPVVSFQFGVDGEMAMFPSGGGGAVLPELLPGDTLSFTLNGVALLGQSALHYGISLFAQALLASGGTFTGADLTLTAGSLAEFAGESGGPLRLVLPGSMMPGPESITPGTPLLRLSVVPEPSALLPSFSIITLALRRRRR